MFVFYFSNMLMAEFCKNRNPENIEEISDRLKSDWLHNRHREKYMQMSEK